MDVEFSGEVWFWRGPAPHHFVTVPEDESRMIEATAAVTSYGWGCIPVGARIGGTSFTTSLFPKDGGYILPVKLAVRRAEEIALGDVVAVTMSLDV